MAIIHLKGPDQGRQIALESAAETLRETPGFLKNAPISEIALTDPHLTYSVGLNDLAAGRLLSTAKLRSWRYILVHRNNAIGEVELNADEKAGRLLEFVALHQTPFAQATHDALRIAERLPQVTKQDYEIRYLKIFAVYLVAIWLHAQSDDILIPLAPSPKGLDANQPYSESQIIQLLKSPVQLAKKFDESSRK